MAIAETDKRRIL